MATRDNRGPTPKALAIVAGVAAFGLAVSILVGGGGSSAAEKSAVDIADNVLPSLMDPSDLAAPVIGSRYDQLASDIQKTVTDPNILRVTVWQRSGVVVFSTNPDLVGLAVSGAKPMVDSAFSGKVQSSVGIGDAMPTDGSQQGETYRTFAPIRLQPGDPVTGVAEVVQPVPAGGSGLWSAAKLVFNVVLIVSLVWLWVVMGRKSNRSTRMRRFDEKQRAKAAAAARVAPQQEPAHTPQPVAEGPLFPEEGAPTVQKPKEAERPRRQGTPATDTWAFGPESPEPAKRKPPKKPAARPKVAEPEIVQPAASEAPAVEPEVAQPVAIEPEVAQPAAAALRHDQLGEAEPEKEEEGFDPGAWIVPRFEQEARRREAELAGTLPAAEPTPSVPEEASVEAKEQDGLQAAQEAQAARDARDEEREAAEAKEREAAEAKEREAAEAKEREEREAAEAALVARAAEREAAQAVHAAELEGLPKAAEPEDREAAEKQALEARDAALLEAAMAREESIRAAERARASREKARAAQEAARAAREEISELEAEIVKLEEARRVEGEARDKVRDAEDAARAARGEELQLEEEARRLREEIRRA